MTAALIPYPYPRNEGMTKEQRLLLVKGAVHLYFMACAAEMYFVHSCTLIDQRGDDDYVAFPVPVDPDKEEFVYWACHVFGFSGDSEPVEQVFDEELQKFCEDWKYVQPHVRQFTGKARSLEPHSVRRERLMKERHARNDQFRGT